MNKSKPALVLAALVLLVAGVSACSTEDDDGANDSPQAPQMEHIHGIGVDPRDDVIYAATHYGLFRIENGTATRVADRVQDFMGFTVAGPDHFLASGHPGAGQSGPSSVGLIESTDGGETWQELSLVGEADFHALEYRHGRVYGFNSMTGQLVVSEDKESWQELSTASIADFAISPDNSNVLIATTQQGLVRSNDGGSTFEAVSDAPLMVFVGWAEDGTLAGVTPEGVLYIADAPDGDWTERGSVGGQPEALTVHSAKEIYAATDGMVLVSTDGGASFSPSISQ
jgi:hypothetical protein